MNVQIQDEEEPQPDPERHDDQPIADLEDQDQQAELIPQPEDDPRDNGIQDQDVADPEVADQQAEEVHQPEGDPQEDVNQEEEGNDRSRTPRRVRLLAVARAGSPASRRLATRRAARPVRA